MGNNELIMKMTEYYSGQPQRVQHFMKVFAFSKMIGEMEHISAKDQRILETAAIVHDIGIKVSEEKYGDSLGKHQEEEGPAVAEMMLKELGYECPVIERVCYLVGHHHTYTNIDGIDYQILVEADFLVNMFENEKDNGPAKKVLENIFRTESGKKILSTMFATEKDAAWEEVGGMPIIA